MIEDYLYRTACHFRSKAYRITKDETLKLRPLESRKAINKKLAFASTEPIEKLVIYSGSPRRVHSNWGIILNKVVEVLGSRVELRDLKDKDKWASGRKPLSMIEM